MTEHIPGTGGAHAAPRTPADRALAHAVDAGGTYHGEDDPRSLGEIASDLLSDASTLIRQEVDLAKAEVQQSASRAGKGAGLMGGAGVTGLFALLFASLAAWWGIAVLIGTVERPALGWSGLIIAVVYAIVALVLLSMGKAEFKRVKGLPRTAETVSKIPNAAAGNEEKNR
ncbi:MAG TPA: phage holin family protein [Propionibacterium sp.]|nr:phage holin family protein [Propionibacterium sp.]